MSKVKIQGNASGTGVVTLTAPNTNTDRTITLPDGDISLGVGIDDNATSTAITIDASKNVGIGVVPKSWYSAFSALQLGSGGAITYDTGSGASKALRVFTNCYRATDGNYKYIYGDEASLIESYDGKTFFKYAAAGSAAGTITWTTSLQLTNDGRGLSQFTAKAWINFDGRNTISIRDSHNISSITDDATGKYQVTMANAMANINYSIAATSGRGNGEAIHAVFPFSSSGNTPTTTVFKIQTVQSWDVWHDAGWVMAQIYGD